MEPVEFSWKFDTLYNNITSNQAPGLSEAEKSMFLTKAQDEVVKNYFSANSKGNNLQQGFDGSQKRQIDFSSITKVYTAVLSSYEPVGTFDPLYDSRANSKSVGLPSDVWMIVNEKVSVLRNDADTELIVKAISFEEYDRLMSKPYKRPLKYQAWRLINNDTSNKCDIIIGPTDTLESYKVRYVKRPKPIILGPLDGLTIDGYCFTGDKELNQLPSYIEETSGECELDPILHEEILQRAVELAKVAWTSTGQDNLQAVVQAGQRSE